jgi:hypothetical protein
MGLATAIIDTVLRFSLVLNIGVRSRSMPTAHFGLVDALTGATVSGFPASGGGSEV